MCSIVFSGLVLLCQLDRLLWIFESRDVSHHVFNGLIVRHGVGDQSHLEAVEVVSVAATNTVAEILDLGREVPILQPRQRRRVDGPDTLSKFTMALRTSGLIQRL